MDAGIRVFFFVAVLSVMLLWEWAAPKRRRRQKRVDRWTVNFFFHGINIIVTRLILGAAVYGAAVFAQRHDFGLFHWVNVSYWFSFFFTLLFLDVAIYVQHVFFHKIPVLWKIHRVHHTDLDLDVTSGVRFHPIEIFLSSLYKMFLVVLFGMDPIAVIIFEVILNGSSLYNHGNVRMSKKWDDRLRLFIVTPDMHRVHHSVVKKETDSNYGFSYSFWDRLFGTYREKPESGQMGMKIGLNEFQDARRLSFKRLMLLPFEK